MHNLYHQTLMDHYQHPRNRRVLNNAHISVTQENPACGDTVSIQAIVAGDTLQTITFQGNGCVISQATASLLTQKVQGYTLAQVRELDATFIQSLICVSLGPTRLKCALLPLKALQEALATYGT